METSSDGFIHVTYSKRKKKNRTNCKVVVHIGHSEGPVNKSLDKPLVDFKGDTDYDRDTALRKITTAVKKMEESEYFKSTIETIEETLSIELKKCLKDTRRIVCYGLGSLCRMTKSIDQFSYLVCLQDLLGTSVVVELYDPVFTDVDKKIISEEYNFVVLNVNEEGRRTVDDDELTFFYLPHCEHELTDCLLSANWSPSNLQNCVIVSNGFRSVLEGHPSNSKKFSYIDRVKSVTCESNLKNNFNVYDVFNDLSLHVFPSSKLHLLQDEDFWRK